MTGTANGEGPDAPPPTSGGAAARPEISEDDELHDKVIFAQELNEVYLLIDFVSGRADRNLSSLAIPNPKKGQPGESDTLNSGDIVAKIAAMRFPPDRNTPVANAQNAAILLLAKDRLTALADPARGYSIAYTKLFADSEARDRHWLRLHRLGHGQFHGSTEAPEEEDPARQAGAGSSRNHAVRSGGDARVTVAVKAFPGLQRHAQLFRTWRDRLAFFAVIWLGITVLTYWDAALGRSVLQRLDQNWKTLTSLEQANPEVFDDAKCQSRGAYDSSLQSSLPDNRSTDDAKRAFSCQSLGRIRDSKHTASLELDSVFKCGTVAERSYLGQGLHFLHKLIHVWCWRPVILSGGIDDLAQGATTDQTPKPTQPTPTPPAAQADAATNLIDWQTATSILTVFTTYILPMMFALLGTLIGAFRRIMNRIRDSELEPRDFMRMRLGIPTGLVAGVAVGLFLSPSSVPSEGSGGVAGELTLTASGLGFLAGYASHSFFTYLENVVNAVFPNTAPANPPAARQAAAPAAAAPG